MISTQFHFFSHSPKFSKPQYRISKLLRNICRRSNYICKTSKNIALLEEKLQTAILKLEIWSHETRFHYSSEKTKCVFFSKRFIEYE